jgi:hypothetical protein
MQETLTYQKYQTSGLEQLDHKKESKSKLKMRLQQEYNKLIQLELETGVANPLKTKTYDHIVKLENEITDITREINSKL